MELPTIADWSFTNIQRQDPTRARHLESADPGVLPLQMREALVDALKTNEVRFAIDSERNQFQICRPIIQFRAPAQCIDAFFNARVGYRAHYWMSPQDGITFNACLVTLLSDCLSRFLPTEVQARKLVVHSDDISRYESDLGGTTLSKETIVRALDPMISKIWLGERLVQQDSSPPKDTGLLLSSIWSPKLDIPRWKVAKNPVSGEIGEGVRAPFPTGDQAWFDVKGGFLDGSQLRQLKDPLKRATLIHKLGWT